MPLWLPIYLLLVVTVTVLAIRDDWRSQPLVVTAVELIATTLLIVSGLAYWAESVRNLLSTAAPYVFVAGLSWIGLSAFREIRKLRPDPELTPKENLASAVVGVSLFCVVA